MSSSAETGGAAEKACDDSGSDGQCGRSGDIFSKNGGDRKRPLGHLVSEFLRSAYSSESDSAPGHNARTGFSCVVLLQSGSRNEKDHAESLSTVVKERNALIHQMLISFNPNSASSRDDLARQLDEQLDRVLPEYQFLSS